MDSHWEEFTRALNDRLDSRIGSMEYQLKTQQELISNLSQTLSGLFSKLQSAPEQKPLKSLEKPKIVKKSQKKPAEDAGEVTKDDSEDLKERMATEDS